MKAPPDAIVTLLVSLYRLADARSLSSQVMLDDHFAPPNRLLAALLFQLEAPQPLGGHRHAIVLRRRRPVWRLDEARAAQLLGIGGASCEMSTGLLRRGVGSIEVKVALQIIRISVPALPICARLLRACRAIIHIGGLVGHVASHARRQNCGSLARIRRAQS